MVASKAANWECGWAGSWDRRTAGWMAYRWAVSTEHATAERLVAKTDVQLVVDLVARMAERKAALMAVGKAARKAARMDEQKVD